MREPLMSERLPPISALRALEAAARLLNFTQAAQELNVTQSAISHQVRHLEEIWGLKLFDRRARQLALTRNGQALAPLVGRFLDRMAVTLEALRNESQREPLRVNMLQSFAVKWLTPRLNRFHEAYPDLDVWISTSEDFMSFRKQQVDVAIRLGDGDYPGLHTSFLLREYVFPVCTPEFVERYGRPSTPQELLKYPLLLRMGEPAHPNWEHWFAKIGMAGVVLTEGPRFPDTNMALQAAMAGQGVALARSAHVGDDLAAGRLIKLFDTHLRSSVSYYLVCPEGTEDFPKIAAFREWVLAEAERAQSQYDRLTSASVTS